MRLTAPDREQRLDPLRLQSWRAGRGEQLLGIIELVEGDEHPREFEPRKRIARREAHRCAEMGNRLVQLELPRVKEADEKRETHIAIVMGECFLCEGECLVEITTAGMLDSLLGEVRKGRHWCVSVPRSTNSVQ